MKLTNPKHLTFDTTIMQSKTVANICRVLRQAIMSNDNSLLVNGAYHILSERRKSVTKYRKKAIKRSKKTTIESKIKQLKESING